MTASAVAFRYRPEGPVGEFTVGDFMSDRFAGTMVVALLIVLVLINGLSLRHKSLTYDEPWHFRYGANILKGEPERFVDGTMPVSALNAALQRVGDLAGQGGFRNRLKAVETGRYVTVAFSLLVALLVYSWSRKLYGPVAGLLSLALYVFSPNVIAHSRLITTDVYAAGMALIATYFFWRFLNDGGWRLATASAVLLALSQLTKYSAAFLYPLFLSIALVRSIPWIADAFRNPARARWGRQVGRFVVFAIFFLAVGLVVINAGFLFDRSWTSLGRYEFRCEAFKKAQADWERLRDVPLPLPYSYLEGLDWGKYREETGKGFGSMYLFGELRETGGFKGYYFFASIFKVPIAVQLIGILALLLYVRRRRYRFLKNEIFLLLPLAFFSIYFNFFMRLQIGIRHFLVAFPFFHVFCGSLLVDWPAIGKRLKILYLGLLAYMIISVLSYFPHYIPYFNELVPDRKMAYKILADSNIDWGQDERYLAEFRKVHPEAYVESPEWRRKRYREKHMEEYLNPQFPDSGLLVVNVNSLVGIYHPHRYEWLRGRAEPSDHIAYSYLVFHLPLDAPADSSR